MKKYPIPTKKMTTVTLMTTMMSLNRADSRIPRIRMPEMMQMMMTANRFSLPGMGSKGEATSERGRVIPNESMIESKVAAQLTETVAAPTAYSSTSAQPMIHAASSPMVAYEYV